MAILTRALPLSKPVWPGDAPESGGSMVTACCLMSQSHDGLEGYPRRANNSPCCPANSPAKQSKARTKRIYEEPVNAIRPTLIAGAATALLCLSATNVSWAQEPRIQAYLYDNGRELQLDYARSDCPWECQVVIFDCSEGLFRVRLIDLPGPQIAEWFDFLDEAPTFPSAQLLLDGNPTQLNFLYLGFGDLNGAWWVELFPVTYRGDGWRSLFGAADNIAIETPVLTLDLPSTEADRSVRAAFVEACLAR